MKWILLLAWCVWVLADSSPVKPCNSSPCQNGGRCLKAPWRERGYFCRCVGGYTGEFCQTGKEATLFRMITVQVLYVYLDKVVDKATYLVCDALFMHTFNSNVQFAP